MLFATGMGIGLVFFGVMEPMHHFNNPPLGLAPLDAQASWFRRARAGSHGRHGVPLGRIPGRSTRSSACRWR